MFTVKSILIPTDFSDHSGHAVSYAREFARSMGSHLHLVHVVEPAVYPADWGYSQVGFVDLERELMEAAERELKTMADQLQKEGLLVTTQVLHGRASDEIVKYAEEHRIDLISIATHGRSGIEHFLFGSTTERVLRKAPCPVLAVRIPPHKQEEEHS